MAYLADDYRPNERSRAILARAAEHVASVPYNVTLRWLFYRLFSEGFYPVKKRGDKKRAYGNFIQLLSRARHNNYGSWRPDTLADDTNAVIRRGGGYDTTAEWLQAMKRSASCILHRWTGQENYVEVWFEARAMISQFEFLTHGVKLCPLGGQPSIPYKWDLAQGLDTADLMYDLPIVVLYFGDLDAGGQQIGETVESDVRRWCKTPFEFVRAALNPGDPERYGLPDNPEKPGQYQWESVDHETASAIIQGAVARYVDDDAMARVARREAAATESFRDQIEHMTL